MILMIFFSFIVFVIILNKYNLDILLKIEIRGHFSRSWIYNIDFCSLTYLHASRYPRPQKLKELTIKAAESAPPLKELGELYNKIIHRYDKKIKGS